MNKLDHNKDEYFLHIKSEGLFADRLSDSTTITWRTIDEIIATVVDKRSIKEIVDKQVTWEDKKAAFYKALTKEELYIYRFSENKFIRKQHIYFNEIDFEKFIPDGK